MKEVNEEASSLAEGIEGSEATVYGTYVKKIYDNGEMLMLILAEEDYLYVRFSSSMWTTHVNNIYFDTVLGFRGAIRKHLGRPEFLLDKLLETSLPASSYDISKIATPYEDIASVYSSFDSLTLSKKYNAVGGVVTFSGYAMASDRSDSNKKVVLSDGKKSITVIGNTKLLSKDEIGKYYKVTGSLSVERSSPAILALSFASAQEPGAFEAKEAKEVLPSYFAKWNTLSDHFSAPSMNDYGTLYKTTCYIADDPSRTEKYYLGAVDKSTDTLSDVGVTTSIKGFFLMNELNLSETDLSYSIFGKPFIEAKEISFIFSMHKFETSWHGWKMFAFEPTIVI